MCHNPVSQAFMVAENSRMVAAVAWVRKYLVVASVARGWWCRLIRGMMARVLISRPIHAINQWELDSVIMVPRLSPNSRVIKMWGFISKGGILTNIIGVWARELELADFTRKWCRGSTESFDLFGRGSNPFFLRSWKGSNLHYLLYQSNPLIQAQFLGLGEWGEAVECDWKGEMSDD